MQFEQPILLTDDNQTATLIYDKCGDIVLDPILHSDSETLEAPTFTRISSECIDYLQAKEWTESTDQDLLCFALYTLNRWEEYAVSSYPDHHGRYRYINSVLHIKNVLDTPIVDYVLLWFKHLAAAKCGIMLSLIQHKPTDITFDIDHAWKYKHKSPPVLFGGLVSRLVLGKFAEARQMINVLLGNQDDPYSLHKWSKNYDMSDVTYFFLLASRSQYDKGISPDNHQLRELIKDLHQRKNQIGIHPSYVSNADENVLKSEIETLSNILKSNVELSRQHYIKLQLPQTYRKLIAQGISSDYSMGYPDMVGFRAGTCRPYLWFDFENNQQTNLKIMPFEAMDVTLKNYMKLSATNALNLTQQLQNHCKTVDGTFRIIWHNSSPPWESEWRDFGKVLDMFLKKASM